MGDIRSELTTWLNNNKYVYKTDWEDFCKTNHLPNAIVVDLRSEAELLLLLPQINLLNNKYELGERLKVRAAAGWADQPVPEQPSSCWQWLSFWSRHNQVHTWPEAQMHAYRQSYSLAPLVGGEDKNNPPVILRFAPAFHNDIWLDAQKRVQVRAGCQLGKVLDFLANKGLALETSGLIPFTSVVGAAQTGSYGATLAAESFAGLVDEITYVDKTGTAITVNAQSINWVTLANNGQAAKTGALTTITQGNKTLTAAELFTNLRGASMGLMGIVTSVTLKTVPNYGLEQVQTTYRTSRDLFAELPAASIFENADVHGLVIMRMASDAHKPNWLIKRCKKIDLQQVPNRHQIPAYEARNPDSFWQHIETVGGAKAFAAMLDADAGPILRKAFLRLAAGFTLGMHPVSVWQARKTIAESRVIEHYQAGYPKGTPLHEMSLLVPVKKSELKTVVPDILNKADDLLRAAWDKGLTPVMFALYFRVTKGTKGGLSVTDCADDEYMAMLDVATLANAPGLQEFLDEFIPYMRQRAGGKLRYHPAKIMPANVQSYAEFLPAENVRDFITTLSAMQQVGKEQSHENGFDYNPFMTDYLAEMLQLKTKLKLTATPPQTTQAINNTANAKLSKQDIHEVATNLLAHVNAIRPELLTAADREALQGLLITNRQNMQITSKV